MLENELPEAASHQADASGGVGSELPPVEQPESGSLATQVGSPGADILPTVVQRLSNQLQDLIGVVDVRLSYDKVKEDAFERLYANLDELKKNAAQDNIRPILLDLVLLYDRMEHAHQEAAAADGVDGFIAIGTVKSFIDELLEVLYRRDVTVIEVVSPVFDPNQQRAIGVENVADQAQHQHIAKVIRRGFQLGSRVLRPEEVIVCRFAEPSTGIQSSGDDGNGG
jgi:molecular chaperone GrpE (heat shock protein)